MRTQKLKPILIAITTIACLFLNFIQNSEAIRIVEMDPSHGAEAYIYCDMLYHTAYLRTTEGLSFVEWQVDGQHVYTSFAPNGVPEVYFSPHSLEGSLQGVDYTITAIAYSQDDEDGDGNLDSHSRSYALTIWKPRVELVENNYTDIMCYVEITKLYYDSGHAVCDGFISVYNLSADETYNIVDWGGRLSCYNDEKVLAPDAKKHIWGGPLEPGEIFYEPIALSMDLASRGANNGAEYTMQADYWVNVSAGRANQIDSGAPQETHSFIYRAQ